MTEMNVGHNFPRTRTVIFRHLHYAKYNQVFRNRRSLTTYHTVKVNMPTMLFFSQASDVSDVAEVKRNAKYHHLLHIRMILRAISYQVHR